MAQRFSLRFGRPERGWLDVVLSGPEGSSEVDASDVPADSLAMLVNAGLDLALGRDGIREVVWFLEPAEVSWSFARHGADIRVSSSMDGGPETPIGTGNARELGFLIWRAMRRDESEGSWATDWDHAFPHREVALLGESLRSR